MMTAAMITVSAQTSEGARPEAGQKRAHYSEVKVETLKLETLKVEMPATAAEAFAPSTSFSYSGEDFKPGVVQVGPRTTYLKEGLTTDEVVRLLGKPATISERTDNGVVVTIYEFARSENRVLVAEFEKGALVRSAMHARRQVAKADR
jgi:outer membrane protein assembly factor BamE (lipoprotein component of BamABCDE complex)